MTGRTPLDDADDGTATVHLFPMRRLLPLREAASHLGIPARRLRALGLLKAGPRPTRRLGRTPLYPIDDLDRYVDALYARARISSAEQARQRQEWQVRVAGPMPLDARGRPVPPVDPFMRIATLDALVEAGGPLALKTLFVAGLGVIFLSHTPLLWRL